MTQTFLISETKLRTFSDINNNVDSELIKNAIREAQDITLQSTLGTLLYDKILDLVSSGDITDSSYSDYKTLLDTYIQDVLLYAAYWYSLDAIYLRPRNNGLIQPNGGENSLEVDMQYYNMKRRSVENKLEYYNNRLTNYLIEEQVLFPELNQSNKLYEQDPDYSSKYGAPFVFNRGVRNANEFLKRGYPVYDQRYSQYPQNYVSDSITLPK